MMTSPPDSPASASADHHPHTNSLRQSIRDGVATSVMLGSGETYLGAFAIFLKALPFQIAILAALPPLVSALFQTLGVWLMERLKDRRELLVWLTASQGLLWLPIASLGLVLQPRPGSVTFLIVLVACYFAAAGLIGPIWNSLIGDLVPPASRGRYFGLRSRACGLATFLGLLCAGKILNLFEGENRAAWGFALIFTVSLVARLLSAYFISKHDDPHFEIRDSDRFSFWDFIRRSPRSNFAKFVFFVAGVNFATNFAAPFFALYMLRELRLSYMEFTLIGAAAVAAQYLTLQHWGNLSDRFGNKKILNICAIGVGLNPLLWLFSANFVYLLIVQLFCGAVWAGFNLTVGNFLFDAVSPPKRARCSAYLSIVNGLGLFTGGIAGGLYATYAAAQVSALEIPLVPASSYFQLFLLSGLLRLASAYVLLPSVNEVRPVEPIGHYRLIFEIVHIRPIAGATFRLFSNGKSEAKHSK